MRGRVGPIPGGRGDLLEAPGVSGREHEGGQTLGIGGRLIPIGVPRGEREARGCGGTGSPSGEGADKLDAIGGAPNHGLGLERVVLMGGHMDSGLGLGEGDRAR